MSAPPPPPFTKEDAQELLMLEPKVQRFNALLARYEAALTEYRRMKTNHQVWTPYRFRVGDRLQIWSGVCKGWTGTVTEQGTTVFDHIRIKYDDGLHTFANPTYYEPAVETVSLESLSLTDCTE